MSDLDQRTAQEVFDDHLRLSKDRHIEEDIRRNYAPDVVVLMASGVHKGHDALRH